MGVWKAKVKCVESESEIVPMMTLLQGFLLELLVVASFSTSA